MRVIAGHIPNLTVKSQDMRCSSHAKIVRIGIGSHARNRGETCNEVLRIGTRNVPAWRTMASTRSL